jgi:hypothetical protein
MASPATIQPHRKLPNEFALVVACCRWAFSSEGADEVRELAASVDWSEFAQTCRRHRVQGLGWHALNHLKVDLPAPAQIALAADARAVADQGLRAAEASARVAEMFKAEGVPLLFLKGLTLAKLVYGNPFVKMGSDIDILVDPGNVAAAAALLGRLGYRLDWPRDPSSLEHWHASRKESAWRGRDGMAVDLHSRVVDQPQLLPTINAAAPSQTVSVAPGLDLPTLADDELFAYLCVHGASSAWFRLKWINDLAAMLCGRDANEISRLYDRSQQLGAGRAAAQALLLAAMLYGTALSDELCELLNTRVNRWLARAALSEMLRGEPTERLLGTRTIHLTQFFLLDGLSYKLSELKRQASHAGGLF